MAIMSDNLLAVTDYPYGGNADVRLERTDVNTVSLVGVSGTSKRCYVQKTSVDVSTDKTLDTDSASDYLISESGGTVSGCWAHYGWQSEKW